MSEPVRPRHAPAAMEGGYVDEGDEGDHLDPLDAVVIEVLEGSSEEREALLGRLEREDAGLARRARSRLAALGELGMSVDGPARAAGPPERVGSFLRERRIGGGGMGEVYAARDARDGARVALKLVRPEHLMFETARARFRREIEATSQLDHPGIVRVLEFGDELGVPWLALEWVGGVSLEDVLELLRGRRPETLSAHDFEQAVRNAAASRVDSDPPRDGAFRGASHVEVATRIVCEVARALAYAHGQGVLHRDVKPSNVLVTPAGRVLLVDFGLALPRGADRMTRTGHWLGSLPYAAPEQIDGSPRALDSRADVYSLAATLYELLTLRTPFLGGPESAVRRRIATGDLEPVRRLNPLVPRELERVLLAALDHDPRRRPSSAGELAAALEAALAGGPVHVRRAPPWLRARRWMRRRPRLALAAAATVLVVGGSLGVALREAALAARLERLGDAELVRSLLEEARAFWPASPRQLDEMSVWLARAEELLAREPEHRRAYAELTRAALPYAADDRSRDQADARDGLATLARELDGLEAYVEKGDRVTPPAPPSPADVRARETALAELMAAGPDELLRVLRRRVATLHQRMTADPVTWRTDVLQLDDFERELESAARTLGQRATFRFDEPLSAWRHDSLRRLLEDLDRLEALAADVDAQYASTSALATAFAGSGAAAWREAADAVRRSPRYGGLELAPVFGLEPLGEDPRSGLWEFLLVASGAAPVREGRDGREGEGSWRFTEDTGVVLVLLPGGRFRMGQGADEGVPQSSSRPQHELELAPFFLARTELTVGQAERLGGFPAERTRPSDGRLPVVLDWERARALSRRFGLDLPTEAQWEYAARADGPLALDGHANVYDRRRVEVLRAERAQQPGEAADFDDGFSDLAPVASALPNGFGLYDTLGNVSEWCLDPYVTRGYSTLSPRAGDGLRATVVQAHFRVVRGGSYADGPELCQPWTRRCDVPSELLYSTGIRPARSLE